MTSFAHVDYSTQHLGVVRAERAVSALKGSFAAGRGAATLLLAAIVAALLVVANQLVDTWTEGHLLAAWVVLWTIGFAALALLAAPARGTAQALGTAFRRANATRRRAAEDRKFWEVALNDARVMADISRAMSAEGVRAARAC